VSVYHNASCWADHYDSWDVQVDTCFTHLSTSFYVNQNAKCADRNVYPRAMVFSDANCSTEVTLVVPQTPSFPECIPSESYAAVDFRCNESVALSGAGFAIGVVGSGSRVFGLVIFVGLVSILVI
jgi:hypothetical protein